MFSWRTEDKRATVACLIHPSWVPLERRKVIVETTCNLSFTTIQFHSESITVADPETRNIFTKKLYMIYNITPCLSKYVYKHVHTTRTKTKNTHTHNIHVFCQFSYCIFLLRTKHYEWKKNHKYGHNDKKLFF